MIFIVHACQNQSLDHIFFSGFRIGQAETYSSGNRRAKAQSPPAAR